MVFDIEGNSLNQGARLIQWPYHGGSNQMFTFEPLGDGSYKIISKRSGLVLDVSGGSTAQGAQIIQWPFHGGDNQRFFIDDAAVGQYRIRSKKSNLVLDVAGASMSQGAPVIQWPKNGGANQIFGISNGYLSKSEVETIIRRQLAGKLDNSFRLYLADEKYFIAPLSEARNIINNTSVNTMTWTEERFDCDDFALVLKAEFAKAAYANNTRRAAFAFGIVWGMLPDSHAINWMINEDLTLRFVEPQNDSIFLPRATDGSIWFMLS